MFTFIIQLLVLQSVNSFSAGETLSEFHVNGTILQQPRVFPCPDAADIAPCVCIFNSDTGNLFLDCTYISSDEELDIILAKEFPVTDFYQFTMRSSTSLTALDFTCGGVKFRQFKLSPGPFPSLVEVSDTFYNSCSSSELESIEFYNTQLSSLVFPPPPLSDNITDFCMPYSNLTSVPAISSDSLSDLNLSGAQISQITPGTFDEIPNLRYLQLSDNNIKILEAGSIPITSNGFGYYFHGNELDTIEPGAFTLKGEPALDLLYIYLHDNLLKTIDASVFELLMPYISLLRIDGNPLDCGCDFAWIILKMEFMDKVIFGNPTCANGTLLTDLDPIQYEQSC